MGELPECVKQFSVALPSNNIERAEDLLKQNSGLIQEKTDFGNWVHLAIRFRYFNVIEFLISRGVGISELDAYGRNALTLVACTGDFEAFKLIYALGAPIDTETALRNPLFSAIDSKSLVIVKFLVEEALMSSGAIR